MITNFEKLIQCLADADAEFIIVGGFAGTLHGSARSTQDLDIVYRRTPDNLLRVVRSLEGKNPYPRGAPEGLPFRWDQRTLSFGVNFTLRTSVGLIDLLGEITGGGDYDRLLPFAERMTVFNRSCLCLNLQKLIQVKRAAGRPKDFDAIAELEAIREESENR